MARAIVYADGGKRFTKEGNIVTVTVGVVAGKEYYELQVTADDGFEEKKGYIIVSKVSSSDPRPKEVYRVPARTKVRKKASEEPAGTDNPAQA